MLPYLLFHRWVDHSSPCVKRSGTCTDPGGVGSVVCSVVPMWTTPVLSCRGESSMLPMKFSKDYSTANSHLVTVCDGSESGMWSCFVVWCWYRTWYFVIIQIYTNWILYSNFFMLIQTQSIEGSKNCCTILRTLHSAWIWCVVEHRGSALCKYLL